MECYMELSDDPSVHQTLKSMSDGEFQVFRAKRADAATTTLEIITYLSPLTIPVIAGLIKEQIRARKHVKVKIKGVELHGLSEKTVEQILQKHFDGKK